MTRRNANAKARFYWALLPLLLLLLSCFALTLTVSAAYVVTEAEAKVEYDSVGQDGWGAGTATITAPAGWQICASENGIYGESIIHSTDIDGPLTYFLKNGLGEIAKKEVWLKLDNTPPVAPAPADAFNVEVTDTTITVTATGWSDALSGIRIYVIEVWKGSEQQKSERSTTGTLTLTGFTPNTTYIITVAAVDYAGKMTTVSSESVSPVVTEQSDLSTATVTLSPSYTYKGAAICPTDLVITLPDGRSVSLADCELSYENNVAISTGKATVTVTGKAGGAYKNSVGATFDIVYLVTDKTATLFFLTDGTLWKGGSATFTAPDGFLVSLDDVTYGATAVYSSYSDGTAPIVYYLKNAATGEIARCETTFKLDVTAPVINGATIDSTDKTATLTVSATDLHAGVVGYRLEVAGLGSYTADASGRFTLTGLERNVKYAYTLTATDGAGNVSEVYTGSFLTSKTSLTDALITVSGNYTYVAAPILPTVSVTLNGAPVDADEYTVSAERNVFAGTATVIITAKSGDAYSYSGSAETTFVIGRAPLTVIAKPQTKIYGTPVSNDMSNVTVEGLLGSDTVSLVLKVEGTQILPDGITVTHDGTDATDSYVIATQSGTLTVTPSTPVITADPTVSLHKTYDGTPVATPTFTVVGAYTGATTVLWYQNSVADANLLTEAPSVPGNYYAVIQIAATAENRAATATTDVIVISRRAVTLRPTEQMIGFGSAPSSLPTDVTVDTAAGLALVDGHTIGSATIVTADVSVTDNGTLTLTAATIADAAGTDVSDYYDITLGTGRLLIKEATLQNAVVTVAGSYTYTGNPIIPAADQITVTLFGEVIPASGYRVVITNNVNAGTATVEIVGTANYGGTAVGSFTIAKAQSAITSSSVPFTNLVYNGNLLQLFSKLPTSAGSPVEYRVDYEGGFTTDETVLARSEAGTYTVHYRAAATENYLPSPTYYVTVTIAKASLYYDALPTVSVPYLGQLSSELTVSGGIVSYTCGQSYRNADGIWQFADPSAPIGADGVCRLLFVPRDSKNMEPLEASVTLTPKVAPLTLTVCPDSATQFAGADVILTVIPKNGVNPDFAELLPTAFRLTWQIGESGEPHEITGNSFTLPADLPMGTVLTVKAYADAVPGCYESATATCTITISDSLSVTIVPHDSTVTSHIGTFDLSTLFEIDETAGAATYSVTAEMGSFTLDGCMLTVTESGRFIVTVSTAQNGLYAAATATATLTYTLQDAPPIDGEDRTVYGADGRFELSELFEFDTTGRQVSYTVLIVSGQCTAENGVLTVTESGVFTVTIEVAATDEYPAQTATASLIYVLDKTTPVVSGVRDGADYYFDRTVEVEDENLLSLTLNGEPVTAPILLSAAEGGSYVIVAIDKAGNVTEITVNMHPSAELAAPLDGMTVLNVKSSDAASVHGVLDLIASLDKTGATLDENKALAALVVRCDELLIRIEAIAAEMNRLQKLADKWALATVTSDAKNELQGLVNDLNALLSGDNLTATERVQMSQISSRVATLFERINAVAAEIKRLEDAAAVYDERPATKNDKPDILLLLESVDLLLDGTNLSEAERRALTELRTHLEEILLTVSPFSEEIDRIVSALAEYNVSTVKSTDQAAIEQLQRDIETLSANTRLDEDERATLTQAAELAKTLLTRIELVTDAIHTSVVEGVRDVTESNVKTDEKSALIAAKQDLEQAMTFYPDNYTAEEKAAVVTSVERIEKALQALLNAAETESLMLALPEAAGIKENDPDCTTAYAAAKAALEALTDHEKTLIGADALRRFNALFAALTNYHVVEGDGRTWAVSNKEGLTFKVTGLFEKFVGVRINGKMLDAANYTATANEKGTSVTLSADYLETCEADQHSVVFLFTDGDADANFVTEKAPFPVWATILIILVACALVALIVFYLKKKRKELESKSVIRENT